MTSRPALFYLFLFLLGGCAENADAPPPAGTENPVVTTPAERPPSAMGDGAVDGAEPGIPGTALPSETFDLDGDGRCYVYDGYAVRVRPRGAVVGEDVEVVGREGASTSRALCDAPGRTVSTPGEPDHFAGVQGSRLFLDRGTGPDGRLLRVIDLARDGALVYESPYEEPILVSDGALTFGRLVERVEDPEALAAADVACPNGSEYLEGGLSVGVVRVVRLDLATARATETDSTYCAPLQ